MAVGSAGGIGDNAVVKLVHKTEEQVMTETIKCHHCGGKTELLRKMWEPGNDNPPYRCLDPDCEGRTEMMFAR